MTVKRRVTLIGHKQAKLGFKFIFSGPTPKCVSCEYNNVCAGNLEAGRVYVVVQVKNRSVPCMLCQENARVVEVEEGVAEAAVDARQAIQDAVITFAAKSCSNVGCVGYEKCLPQGLRGNDRCKVLKVLEPLKCPFGLQLVQVLLERQA